jgi:MFS family permease
MDRTADQVARTSQASAQGVLLPLVLAQFMCSFAATSTNVAISSIANSLGTTVSGVQVAITAFTLTMAALMIPGSKLTDIWGRKFCLRLGLAVYGAGALMAAASQSLGLFIGGYSLGQGIGTALLIPPVYIFATIMFPDLKSRARAFGAISAAGGIGSAAGPLIGGIITSATSWRVTFLVQTLLAVFIIYLSRRIEDPGVQGAKPRFDLLGAVLSALGLFFVVFGILQADPYGWLRCKQDFVIGNTVVIPQGGISPVWVFVFIGALLLLGFFLHIRSTERAGKQPLLSIRMFQNRLANLGLVTQSMQWLVLQGLAFVVSVFLQVVWGYSPIQTGLILTPATVGILLGALPAARLAKRFPQITLIRAGFVMTVVGVGLLLLLVPYSSNVLTFAPGLFLIGVGVGVMITSSVNVVQSSFAEKDQGEISGLSRSVSNLGSSLGVAIAGTVIVSEIAAGNTGYALAIIVLGVAALIGLVASILMRANSVPQAAEGSASAL